VIVCAPAKVNLYLAVGSKRPDGYHDVLTVMQSLSLADDIVLRDADALALECAPDPCPSAEDNLAYRAARSLAVAHGVTPRARISISKRIPAGAGLGGGSADAAATLLGLAALWELPTDAGLRDVAASLGADVPFALEGGTALLAGRGDELVRRLPTPALDFVLVNPGVPVSTAAAYAAVDASPPREAPSVDALLAALESGDAPAVALALHNDMTTSSCGLVPVICDALECLRGTEGVLGAEMAGSGSTVFGICRDPDSAARAAEAARSRGWWATSATAVANGASIAGRERGA